MLKLLGRYIARTLISATLITTIIITGIVMLLILLGELKNIGQGDYGIAEVLMYVLLKLPSQIYQFSPLLILLGCLVGLSHLSQYRELSVMRASGFTTTQIIKSVLASALILILAFALIGELLGPNLSYKAEIRKENAEHARQAVVTAAGVWFHVDDNFIHIQHVIGRKFLRGITRYQFDNQQHLLAAYYADTLLYENNQWIMQDVRKTTFTGVGLKRTHTERLPSLPWDVRFDTNLLKIGLVEPEEMSLARLAEFSHYLEKNGLQSREYRFAFWQRILQPLSTLMIVFLSIPFILTGTSRNASMSLRILIGVMVGFAFFILNALLAEICIVYQVPPILAAAIPPLIFMCFGFYLARKLLH